MWGRAQRVFLFFIFFVLFLPATINASRLISITTCGKIDEKAIKPIDIKDLFTQETTEIHVIAVVDGFKAGVKMKGTFISVDAVNPPNYKIDSLEKKIKKDGKERLHFSLSKPAKGWPAGKYKFTLHANGILIATAPFSVAPDSGEKPSSGFQLGPVQEDKNRAWTVVVYMDGDNNLEPFALKDLDEMERSLPKKGVDVIVLLDRSEEYSDEQGNWADARVFRIRSDREKGVKSEVLATPGELNMGDTAVLQAFLSAARRLPARSRTLTS
jgi:hypothetical protein